MMSFRRRMALWLCPELESQQGPASARPVVAVKADLLTLCESLAAHQGVTHFAISMRFTRKGDFFKNLMRPGADCRTRTATRAIAWFDANWPADLEWPRDIPRPRSTQKKEAA